MVNLTTKFAVATTFGLDHLRQIPSVRSSANFQHRFLIALSLVQYTYPAMNFSSTWSFRLKITNNFTWSQLTGALIAMAMTKQQFGNSRQIGVDNGVGRRGWAVQKCSAQTCFRQLRSTVTELHGTWIKISPCVYVLLFSLYLGEYRRSLVYPFIEQT